MKQVIGFMAISFTVLAGCNSGESTSDAKVADIATTRKLEGAELVKRGNYLVLTGACNDCHSPKIFSEKGMSVDSSKLLSGHPANSPLPPIDMNSLKPGNWISMAPDITAFVGPWGISYAANLTSDSATGIGAWSESTFIQALRTRKHMGMENGRPIMPPMPVEYIGQMNDDDLKAIYAYLKSLPPVSNKVPAPVPPNEVKPGK